MNFRNPFTPYLLTALSAYALFTGSTFAQSAAAPVKTTKAQRLFLQCQSCHEITESKIVKSGPNLKGVFGRKVASLEGYNYSGSLKTQTFVWDETQLDKWLERPTAIAPGTAMAFIGLPKSEDRKLLIDFLKSAN